MKRLVPVLVFMTSAAVAAAQPRARMSGAEADSNIGGMNGALDRAAMKEALTADTAGLRGLSTGADENLARYAIAEAVRRRDPGIYPSLLGRVSDRRSTALSALAARALADTGGAGGESRLRKALSDSRNRVRVAAGLTLAKWGDRQSIPALREGLEGGESKDRIACAGYLAGFGDMRSVPRIIRLVDELNGVERRRLCKALGKFGDSGSRRKLLWMLTNEQYSGTRARAALALGVRGNRRAVPGLIAALKQKSPDVRYAAAKALGVIGDSRAIPALRAAALPFPQGMRAYSMEERAREAASQAIAFLTTDRGSAPGRAPLDLSR